MGEARRAESSEAREEQERLGEADTLVDFQGPFMTEVDLTPDQVEANGADLQGTVARHLKRSDDRMVKDLRSYLQDDDLAHDKKLTDSGREEARKAAQNSLWDFKRQRVLWEVMERARTGSDRIMKPEGVPDSMMPDDAERLEAIGKYLRDSEEEMKRTWFHHERFRNVASDENRPVEERKAAARTSQDFLKEFKDAKAVWTLMKAAEDELLAR